MIEGLFSTRDLVFLLSGMALSVLIYLLLLRPTIQHRFSHELANMKDQFVALASHYLLTPITIIQTALSRLQEGDLSLTPGERQHMYEAIGMGQQRLWIIAEQLVLINEIDRGVLQLRQDVADVSEVVSAAVAAMDIFARTKKITISLSNDLSGPTQTRLDARRMKQALIAVLDNAIKFSMEDSQIQVQVGQEDGYFVVRVKDQGIGMPEEVLNHLSEKFYRGSSIYSFDYEGIGLGLFIAFAILRLHQGMLQFESKPKLGTITTLRFPRN